MLSREHEWVWDSWYITEGDNLHAFYLMAPKALGDPELRHVNAQVGHSVSRDGVNWEHFDDVFGPGDADGFSGQAIWTGSIIRVGDTYHWFYTGIARETSWFVQRIGHATSPDLRTWTRTSTEPVLSADPRWLLTADASAEGHEPFRDPWVFGRDGDWHMLVTASERDGVGTIAHATSTDLHTWTMAEPLVHDSGFGQIEVVQTLEVDGRWVLVFCTGVADVRRPGVEAAFATYSAPAAGPLGPFDLDHAEPITPGGGVYAARVVELNGELNLFGFLDTGQPGGFTGTISDPIPLELSERGTLRPRVQSSP